MVSVIMPCYNSEKYIEQAIQSILNQTFPYFELLIINDGSIDNTENKIKIFNDSRIRYFKFSENFGVHHARNQGLSKAKGKYICMMDSDDIALSNRLEVQFDYMESDFRVGCVGSSYEVIDQYGKTIGIVRRPQNDSMIKIWLLSYPVVYQPTIMYRSSLIKKYNLFYDEEFFYAEDYDFLVRLSSVTRLYNIPEVLVKYRYHSEQITSSKKNELKLLSNKVRASLLERLVIIFTEKELKLHLKLMRNESIRKKDLKSCLNWIDKLLRANNEKKIYNTKHFYKFIKHILSQLKLKNTTQVQ